MGAPLGETLGMSLRRAWEAQADNWIAWTRLGIDDRFFSAHAARFLELVPPPGHLTLDLGAGEGRVGRLLRERGHRVVEVDTSARAVRAGADLSGEPGIVGDVARLPLRSMIADLAIVFMSFQDVDDMPRAVGEAARTLEPSGTFVFAIVHPMNSAGRSAPVSPDDERLPPFVVTESYLEHRHYADEMERDGRFMRFESLHRPLEAFSRALQDAGFLIETLREIGDVSDPPKPVPLFLDVRARKSA